MPLGEICSKNFTRQLGASELEKLKDENATEIKLLPSSKNYDWFSDDEENDYIFDGKVITLGRARYANLKYYEGKFISSNNILITSQNENNIKTKYLYYFIANNVQEFYVETSTYPKFDSNIFDETMIQIPLKKL